MSSVHLSGVERFFNENDLIVSKTDPRGIITYANHTFIEVSGYSEDELLGKPHALIRHPHMPRCAFKLVWDTIKSGSEIFAYVLNRSKNGDHYWVLAHVTPNIGPDGSIVGYHSSRRLPTRKAIDTITPIYQALLQIEREQGGQRGLEAAFAHLLGLLEKNKISYEQFVLSL